MALRAYSNVHVLLWAGLALLYRLALTHWQPRRGWFSLAAGSILGLCQSLGEVLNASGILWQAAPLVPGYILFYTAWCSLLLAALDARNFHAWTPQKPSVWDKLLGADKKHFLRVFLLLVLCWVPWFIILFPGVVSADIVSQMYMGLGVVKMTSHHPPLHSYWLGGMMQLGQALFGSFAAGVALAAFLQMLFMAGVLAATLYYMALRKVARPFQVGAALVYALSPGYSLFTVTLLKDMWLGSFTLLFVLLAADMMENRKAFFASKGKLAALALVCAGNILSKNTGVWLLVTGFALLLVLLRGCRKQLATALVLCLVFVNIVEGPIYNALHIQKGDAREALSIPMMQMSRVIKDAPQTLAPQDEAMLRALLPFDDMETLFDFRVVDSVKSEFQTQVFKEDLRGYIGLWVRLGLAHPNLYIRTFLELSLGYFYPDTMAGMFILTPYPLYIRQHGIDFDGLEPRSGQYREPMAPAVEWLQNNVGRERNVPGLNMLLSVGFHFWVLLFCCIYLLYKKDYAKLGPMGILVGVWLTCLASPVYSEFRYAFGAVMAMPFMVGYCLAAPPAPALALGRQDRPKQAHKNKTGI